MWPALFPKAHGDASRKRTQVSGQKSLRLCDNECGAYGVTRPAFLVIRDNNLCGFASLR
jgi:hypothetical protein